MYDVGLVQSTTAELDGVVANDQFDPTKDVYNHPHPLVNASGHVLLRDCTVTWCGPITTTGTERIYVVHCTFTGCGRLEEWEYFDPFVHSPLFRVDHFAHAMIANCLADKTNRGHSLHRAQPTIDSVPPAALQELFAIT